MQKFLTTDNLVLGAFEKSLCKSKNLLSVGKAEAICGMSQDNGCVNRADAGLVKVYECELLNDKPYLKRRTDG